MKIPIVKALVNGHELEALKAAELDILEEKLPAIKIEGENEGEQLTHVMAAIWIKVEMAEKDIPLNKAMRYYTVKVRTSIS